MTSRQRQFVWDMPVRVFHWSLVGLLGFSWWSAETRHMDWHLLSGQAVLFLILFRLIWGLVGSDPARFSRFIRRPRTVWAYLTRKGGGMGVEAIGHNPAGGWSVIAMLFVLTVQVVTGLFAVDIDGIESGPLSYLVDFDQGRWASSIHAISFNGLLALIALHIVAILFHLIARRNNLVGAMVTGSRPVGAGEAVAVRKGHPIAFLIALGLSGSAAWWLFAQG